MKKTITNTTKQAHEDPMSILVKAMFSGPKYIEDMEDEGQQELVNSSVLPADMQDDTRKVLEAAGVVFGAPVGGDPMFLHVTLPGGWKKRPTDHSMWSKLVDQFDRERAGIFYKAAFYDRSAHMRATPRFSVQFDYDVDTYTVKDGTRVIHTSEPVGLGRTDPTHYARRDALQATTSAWLTERYPDYCNAAAYWDVP